MQTAAQPRQLTLDTPLGPGALTLIGLTGQEALSRLFSFQLDLVSSSPTPIPFDELIGRPVTAGVGGGRFYNGLVSRFSAGGQDGRSAIYRAELVPQLWLLTRRAGTRSFQDVSVPDIVRQVLTGAGLQATFELTGTYPPRSYTVQHNETDFDFISRLLEDEGIWFTFRHGPGGHELVLGDDSAAVPDAGTFPFDARNAGRVDPPRVLSWEKTQELTSGKVTLRDHHFQVPDSSLEGTATILPAVQAGQVTHRLRLAGNDGLELYDYPGGYAERFDEAGPGLAQAPAHVAMLRMEEEAARAVVIGASSTCRTLAAGVGFGLSGHADADGRYLVTSVEHAASQPAGANGAGGLEYQSRLTAIPAALPFRPPRTTHVPVVHGPQTAVVVGPAGSEIHTDRFGRVKVQFHWDREGSHDENSSNWIRVVQPVGGAGGAFWVPEVGDEVLVAFEQGDPDRPYVIGRVFNSHDPPDDDR